MELKEFSALLPETTLNSLMAFDELIGLLDGDLNAAVGAGSSKFDVWFSLGEETENDAGEFTMEDTTLGGLSRLSKRLSCERPSLRDDWLDEVTNRSLICAICVLLRVKLRLSFDRDWDSTYEILL